MPGTHTVVQGDHLSKLAEQYGFSDYRTIWDHPENAALKSKRKDPNILLPGDTVFIPELKQRTEEKAVDQKHTFEKRQVPLMLRLDLVRSYDKPVADTPCDLFVDFVQFSLTTDGDGLVEQKIPKTAQQALLVVKDKVQIKGNDIPVFFQVPVRIGHLDPLDEPSGQMVRLANLGYYRLEGEDLDEDEFRSAVEEFQCEHGLAVDGICGPQTQAKLKVVHGC